MMATATKSKKSAKPSKSAKPKPDASSTDRLRKSVLKEITDRIAKGEKPEPTTDAALHEGTITRSDGEVVKVSVPADHSEQGGPNETSPTAPKTPKPKNPKTPKAEKAPKTPREPRKPKPAKAPKPKRVSALDAAATVLADTKKPMRAIDLIAEIQQRGLWQSPKGKTPEASLYAAIIREISAKGKDARFAKHERGLFIAQVPTNAPASA